jgi:hypothetical protein
VPAPVAEAKQVAQAFPAGGAKGARMRVRLRRRWAVAALPLGFAPVAAAQESPISLAEDPFEITDPLTANPGEGEWSFVGAYERARNGQWRSTGTVDSELGVGVARGLELRLGQTGAYGNLDAARRLDLGAASGGGLAWGGNTRLGALVQLLAPSETQPAAVGLLGRMRTDYGPGRPAYEAEMFALMGVKLGDGDRPFGLGLNLGWTQRLNPEADLRSGRWAMSASLGKVVGFDTAVALTYVRELQERGQPDAQLLQASLRHRLPGGALLGFAMGAGLSTTAPRYQIAIGVQWPLQFIAR